MESGTNKLVHQLETLVPSATLPCGGSTTTPEDVLKSTLPVSGVTSGALAVDLFSTGC